MNSYYLRCCFLCFVCVFACGVLFILCSVEPAGKFSTNVLHKTDTGRSAWLPRCPTFCILF